MNQSEVRSLLGLWRAGESAEKDSDLAEAQRQAETDPELMNWWAAEQELDAAIGAKLQSTHAPAELRDSLTLASEARQFQWRRSPWNRPALALAAAVIALAVLFGSWRGPFQPSASLADYRDEMVGFVKVEPSLELRTSEIDRVQSWLAKSSAPSVFVLPGKLSGMEPAGCRTLRYRGRDVALVCFKRGQGELLHLLLMNKGALPNLPDRSNPAFAAEGEWMTAAWQDNGEAYLILVQGDREQLAAYLNNS